MDLFFLQRITFQFIRDSLPSFFFLFLSFETAQVELFSSDDASCSSVYGVLTNRNLHISRESNVGCPGVFAFASIDIQEQLQCNISNCKLNIYILTLYNISHNATSNLMNISIWGVIPRFNKCIGSEYRKLEFFLAGGSEVGIQRPPPHYMKPCYSISFHYCSYYCCFCLQWYRQFYIFYI